jgi:uncharacterized SAM-binding protein YcdF (DUF218 family)
LINPMPNERWVLVTSAAQMPRAIGAFRKVGFSVEAFPVDWQTKGSQDLRSFFGSPLGGLLLCDAAAHQWVGLLAYWLIEQTSACFRAHERIQRPQDWRRLEKRTAAR